LFLISGQQTVVEAKKTLPCPAVKPDGTRPPLIPNVAITPQKQPGDDEVDLDMSKKAVDVVGFFESNGKPYQTISNHELISLGFLQWNWGTQSLITEFFKAVSSSDIDLAPNQVKNDLSILKQYSESMTPSNRAKALAVVNSWITPTSSDPLQKDVGVRKSIVENVGMWLGTPALQSVQLDLAKGRLQESFFYARAWLRDTKSTNTLDARLVTYFFDLLVFNGGTSGLWADHVNAFRANYATRRLTVDAVSDWLSTCDKFYNPNTKHHKLYATKDGLRSAAYWKSQVADNENVYDENQINLLVLGLLRAQRSTGRNKPLGFPGIYQADVLTRRGVIAIGGFARGSKEVLDFFPK
jgi:hypothetical protein